MRNFHKKCGQSRFFVDFAGGGFFLETDKKRLIRPLFFRGRKKILGQIPRKLAKLDQNKQQKTGTVAI